MHYCGPRILSFMDFQTQRLLFVSGMLGMCIPVG
jgi:hypothetical protein